MIADRINNNLSALFDTDADIYKVIISDVDGTIPTTVNKPADIDIGAIASQKEYLRRLALYLVRQMYLDQAETIFLEYILNDFFDSLRLTSETDTQWITRVLATIFNHKVSRATIIVALRPFSSLEPEITNVSEEAAFADFSYADVYVKDADAIYGTGTLYVLPAVAENFESAFFTIRITLYDTPFSEVFTVRDIIEKIVAAGISVQFLIRSTA